MSVTAVADTGRNRAGLIQQRRRWHGPRPHAVALLIHGLGEHSGRYDHVGRFLADRGIDVVAIDLRGFGLSGGRRAHIDHFDDHLDDVEDQLAEVRRMGLPVVLVGHSMGGLICTRYALSHRAQPDLVVLSGPALGANAARWQLVAAPRLARVAPRLRVPGGIDPSVLSTDDAVGAAYLADPLVCLFATANLGAELFAAMADTTDRVPALALPTLVLHGGDDRLVPPEASEPFDGLPGVRRIVYPGLRHEIFNEPSHPEILTSVVDWVDEQLAR